MPGDMSRIGEQMLTRIFFTNNGIINKYINSMDTLLDSHHIKVSFGSIIELNYVTVNRSHILYI